MCNLNQDLDSSDSDSESTVDMNELENNKQMLAGLLQNFMQSMMQSLNTNSNKSDSSEDDASSEATFGDDDDDDVSIPMLGEETKSVAEHEDKKEKDVEPELKDSLKKENEERSSDNLVECQECKFKFIEIFTTKLSGFSICFFCKDSVKLDNNAEYDRLCESFKGIIKDENRESYSQHNAIFQMHIFQSVKNNKKTNVLGIALNHIYFNSAVVFVRAKLGSFSAPAIQATKVTKYVVKLAEEIRKRNINVTAICCSMSPIFKDFLLDSKYGEDMVFPDVFDVLIAIVAQIWMGKTLIFGDIKIQFDPDILELVFPDCNPLKKRGLSLAAQIMNLRIILQSKNIQKLYKHHKIIDSLTLEEKYQQTCVFEMLKELLNYGLDVGFFVQANEDFFEKLDKNFERFEVEKEGHEHHLHDVILQNSVRNLSKNLLSFYRKYGKFQKRSASIFSLNRILSEFEGKLPRLKLMQQQEHFFKMN